jgi:hypothetical protein
LALRRVYQRRLKGRSGDGYTSSSRPKLGRAVSNVNMRSAVTTVRG